MQQCGAPDNMSLNNKIFLGLHVNYLSSASLTPVSEYTISQISRSKRRYCTIMCTHSNQKNLELGCVIDIKCKEGAVKIMLLLLLLLLLLPLLLLLLLLILLLLTIIIKLKQNCNMYVNQQDTQILVDSLYFPLDCSTCFGISLVHYQEQHLTL